MLIRAYFIIGVLVLSLYGVSGLLGWEMRSSGRNKIDPSVRSSPGGLRTFHFWHAGYHGGK